MGESHLKLTARDVAKIGALYLQHGRWGDKQIVPEACGVFRSRHREPGHLCRAETERRRRRPGGQDSRRQPKLHQRRHTSRRSPPVTLNSVRRATGEDRRTIRALRRPPDVPVGHTQSASAKDFVIGLSWNAMDNQLPVKWQEYMQSEGKTLPVRLQILPACPTIRNASSSQVTTKSQTSISNVSAFRRFVRNGWVASSTVCQPPAAVGFSISVVVQASRSRVILLHLARCRRH